ncbi:hypothetical protein [uncultured Rhodoblastus sp.]|uniref:hypothetical protein n=1 Tax=uncultured Rhodoblastus sp. TaxID=543037 RepID=UPI0025D42B58|nr:hypothetical protein [uncultured Rhodoblastus sp.]
MDDQSRKLPKIPSPPLSLIGSASAPFVYFEGAPTFGFDGAIGNITLEAITHIATDDRVVSERRVVAHLRMGAKGLASLKRAIESIELMANPGDGSIN